MARLRFPDEASRMVWQLGRDNRFGLAADLPAVAYASADEGDLTLADIRTVDGQPIAGATLTVDRGSGLPDFDGPDGDVAVVYVSVAGGPRRPVYASRDGRIGEVAADVAAEQTARSAAFAALPTTYAGLSGNIQATVRKLADDVGDVNVLVLGDSTASQPGQWPFLLMPMVQALYPHRSLKQSIWGGTSYPALSTTATGTGSYAINFWQGAVTGTVPESVYANWEAQVAAVQPDLVMVHYGHNYGATAAAGGFSSDLVMDQNTLERFTRFIALIKQACPNADVLIASQNPYLTAGARAGLSTVRAQMWRSIAADLGCAYGPVLEAYLATGNPAAYLQADLLHPTVIGSNTGAQLAANALLPLFRYQATQPPSARVPSPFLTVAPNLMSNGDFKDFTSPPTLPGWATLNATLSKNTTIYESKGYSLQIAAAAGTGGVSVYQTTPPINLSRIKGQVVTAAARVYLPAASSSSAGRIQLTGGGGVPTITSATISLVKDQWTWIWATGRVPAGATFVTIGLLCGLAGSTDVMYVDRAALVLGHLPREAV